ncbi:MAG: CotH kinase family protein [Bacteroidetes bacterium]|nr:CotH kinase family protein [Bacteroidota bacterium]
MKKIFSILILLSVYFQYAKGQGNFPENGPLYIDTVVPRIDITINPDTLNWIYENPDSDVEFHAVFVFNNGTIADTINPVGFRLRGNTSRYSAKKSFKVSFNTFTSGGKYYGVEKLNLNGEHNDPSVIRSKVMWDILRKTDIPAPRANHVELYINGNYHGLYINVEHIDEEFVLLRFGNNDGNLFKCLYPADLDYLGSNPDAYKLESGGRRVYELKINEELDDYSDLAEFINILNNAANNHLVCQLDEVFNTYDYLKIVAADVFCGNWDGYIFNKNNFYLYHNTQSGKFEFIPYDVDNTFGIDWFNIDWTTRNMYNWEMQGEPRPLYTRLMDNQELRDQYTYYAGQFLSTYLNMDSLIQSVSNRRDMIAPYIANDPYYPLDYGYNYNTFIQSYTQSPGAHVKEGLFPYLQERKSSMLYQLENTSMQPVIKYIQHMREANQKVHIQAVAETESPLSSIEVLYRLDDGNVLQQPMQSVGDGYYAVVLSGISEETKVGYQIRVIDEADSETTMPCTEVIIYPATGDTPLLFINEIMADNESTIADEHGNYSDWIEIYNGDSEPVFLGDFYLTDNFDSPNKWKMPSVTLPVNGFALFWADGDPSLGEYHASFKLSKDGEETGIFSATAIPVDQVSFGVQTEDISYGRLPDGTSAFVFFNTPTPGAPNQPNSLDEIVNKPDFYAYPNPASEVVTLNKPSDIRVFNSTGLEVFRGNDVTSLLVNQFTKGLYFILTDEGERTLLVIY